MLRRLIPFLFALWLPLAGADDLTVEKQADIRKLLDVTGSANLALQMASVASEQILQSMPDIPERAIPVIKRELATLYAEKISAPGGFMDETALLYHKYFTHPEIEELIAFYETRTGRKAIAVLPQLMRDAMVVGEEWGKLLAPEAERRVFDALRREGLLPTEQ